MPGRSDTAGSRCDNGIQGRTDLQLSGTARRRHLGGSRGFAVGDPHQRSDMAAVAGLVDLSAPPSRRHPDRSAARAPRGNCCRANQTPGQVSAARSAAIRPRVAFDSRELRFAIGGVGSPACRPCVSRAYRTSLAARWPRDCACRPRCRPRVPDRVGRAPAGPHPSRCVLQALRLAGRAFAGIASAGPASCRPCVAGPAFAGPPCWAPRRACRTQARRTKHGEPKHLAQPTAPIRCPGRHVVTF